MMKKFKNLGLLALFSVATNAPVYAVERSNENNNSDQYSNFTNKQFKKLTKIRLLKSIANKNDEYLDKTLKNNPNLFDQSDLFNFLNSSITQDNYSAVKILQSLITNDPTIDNKILLGACTKGSASIIDGICKNPDFDQKKYEKVIEHCINSAASLGYSEVVQKINENFDINVQLKLLCSTRCDEKTNSTETLKHFFISSINKFPHTYVKAGVFNVLKKGLIKLRNEKLITDKKINEINDYVFSSCSFFQEFNVKNIDREYFKKFIDACYCQLNSNKIKFNMSEEKFLGLKSIFNRILNDSFKNIIYSQDETNIPAIKYTLQKFIDGEIELSKDLVNWDDRKKENLLTKIYTSDQEGKNFHVKVLEKIEELEQVHSKQVSEVATDENKKNKKNRKKNKKNKQTNVNQTSTNLMEEERKE